MPNLSLGIYEGDTCNRNDCNGVVKLRAVENCSCHINPPCGACTKPRHYCPVCDWQEADDVENYNTFVPTEYPGLMVWNAAPKPLDKTKIDYRIESHTNSSQICRGVYPEGTTSDQVLEKVKGSFGGRFNQFGSGTFEYVAYTD